MRYVLHRYLLNLVILVSAGQRQTVENILHLTAKYKDLNAICLRRFLETGGLKLQPYGNLSFNL